MAEEKPRLEIVVDKPELAAGNVFDDLDTLRKASKLNVKRQWLALDRLQAELLSAGARVVASVSTLVADGARRGARCR